jgi:hypothetical protein
MGKTLSDVGRIGSKCVNTSVLFELTFYEEVNEVFTFENGPEFWPMLVYNQIHVRQHFDSWYLLKNKNLNYKGSIKVKVLI